MGKNIKTIVVLVGEDDSQFYFKGYDSTGNIQTTDNKDDAKRYGRFFWSERQWNEMHRQGFKKACVVPETSDCPIGTGDEIRHYFEEAYR